MQVMIVNALDEPVHIAVVRHSSQAVEFVISPERVPIPCGRVMRRDDVGPDHALVLTGLDTETELSAFFDGYAGTLSATLVKGKNKDGPFWKLTLLELRTDS